MAPCAYTKLTAIMFLTHTSGTQFELQRHLDDAHSFCVDCIVVHDDFIVTCSRVKTGKVWNAHNLRMRTSVRHIDEVHAAAVDHNDVVTAT